MLINAISPTERAKVAFSDLLRPLQSLTKHGMSLSQALEHVRSKRPSAAPNPGFILQSKEFEKYLQGAGASRYRHISIPWCTSPSTWPSITCSLVKWECPRKMLGHAALAKPVQAGKKAEPSPACAGIQVVGGVFVVTLEAGAWSQIVLHILRDCGFARDVWNHVSPQASLLAFFTAELHDWILQNINTTATWSVSDIHWNLIFASIFWHLWKTRNSLGVQAAPSTASPHQLDSPPFLWIALNIDGALCSGTKIATIGGLLRDSSGHWLGGFNRIIGSSNDLQAELWVIHSDLCLAWDLGYRLIQIRSDRQKAIAIINDPNALSCQLPLVRVISLLKLRIWELDLLGSFEKQTFLLTPWQKIPPGPF
ncbi:hypothetical protein F3Y22_tig00110602pilonHSYRG00119 [Hibiscus syriacus]|uniref:RNase H type-1 domain-containing protein n=1 Tax=Hibiscus syriacus TaxID=106335 RepID=A0A6A3A4C5_HIBSY|nr:hypothetical protein F3Y22_tig00110602pilonHSYRG00119 [Hibiscus syriacus]